MASRGVFLAGSSAAGIYATVTIRNNREIARLKATLDLIEKAESSEFERAPPRHRCRPLPDSLPQPYVSSERLQVFS
jgi:hypothetical protein